MFLGNLFCLVQFMWQMLMGLYADLTEPHTSFTLAMNSPFSTNLAGVCGGGPSPEQLLVDLHLKQDADRHYYLLAGANSDTDVPEDESITRRRPKKAVIEECNGDRSVHHFVEA